MSPIRIFSDARDALVLYLLPAVCKPTGRPQLPVSEAQEYFLRFVTDVRHVKQPKKKTPHVTVVFKSVTGASAFQEVIQVVLYMEGKYYMPTSVVHALEEMYASFWLFGIKYHPASRNAMHFIQKHFLKMSYINEKCSPATTKLLSILDA